MDVFNPKILDASIRDVASCLSDTQKVDLLLYALAAIPLPPAPQPHQPSPPSTASSATGPVPQAYGSAPTTGRASASASPAASYTPYPQSTATAQSSSSSTGHSNSGYTSHQFTYTPFAPFSSYNPAHTLLENGIASVLQVRKLSGATVARARVLRARARMRMRVGGGVGVGRPYYNQSGMEGDDAEREWVGSVRDDLHAALAADPANKDARALLATLDGEPEPEADLDAQHEENGNESDGRADAEGERDVDEDMGRDRDVEMTPATRGPSGADKILSPMASPTHANPPKPSARPTTGALGSRPIASTSSRPHLPHASSSYSSTSSHASGGSTSTSYAMPPPASPTPTPLVAPHTYSRRTAPAVHIPQTRLSAEVWRLVGSHLSQRDLANLLYIRHPLSLVAAERLAEDVEVWFGSWGYSSEWDGVRRRARGAAGSTDASRDSARRGMEDGFGDYSDRDADYDDVDDREKRRDERRQPFEDEDADEERKGNAKRATRTAHLLARVIRDPTFAARVKTLRVYFGPGVDSKDLTPSRAREKRRARKEESASPGVAFQTGMLSNALPSLSHLRNVHISGGVEAMLPVLRILQRRAPRLTGLSLTSPDSPPDLSFLDLRRLVHFSYTITGPTGTHVHPASSAAVQRVLAGAQSTLRSVALLNPYAAVGYLQPQPPQGTSNGTSYAYNNSPPTATATAASTASASYNGPIGHQQLLNPQPSAQSSASASPSTSNGAGSGYSRHGQSQQQQGQYPQYPLTHPYAPSPHQHALPSHARSLAPHPHSAHAHSAQTHASAMMSVHALAGGSGGSSSSHVGPASSGVQQHQQQVQQRDQAPYRPRIAPAPPTPTGYTPATVSESVHSRPAPPPSHAPPPAPVPLWVFPTGALSLSNLTRIQFSGAIPAGSRVFADILTHGRHLETLDIECAPLECTDAAQQFLDAASGGSSSNFRSSLSSDGPVLPRLANFGFTVSSLSRRYADASGPGAGMLLFPAIAEFLRGRRTLRTLALLVAPQASAAVEAQMHSAVGFDASVWGVLPSLQGALQGVRMTYPADLSAGLAGWLVPRSVHALGIVMGESGPLKTGGADGTWTPGSDKDRRSPSNRDWDRERDRDDRTDKQRAGREAMQFLSALKTSLPPGLSFVSLPESLLSILSSSDSSANTSSTAVASLIVEHGFPSVRVVRMGSSYWTVSRKSVHASGHGHSYSSRDPSAPPSYESHMYDDRKAVSGRGEAEVLELEKWPRHRAAYHTSEWLAWYGCEDAVVRDVDGFSS